MANKLYKNFAIIFIAILSLTISSCTYEIIEKPVPEKPPLKYVGSTVCKGCHGEIYDTFIGTGHSNALTLVDSAMQPENAFNYIIPPPTGYDWSQVQFLIGGFGWKACFVDTNGFVFTNVDGSQYNVNTSTSMTYEAGTAYGSKLFDCGKCHTTGWKSIADGGIAYNSLPGMDGGFSEPGVTCEACHGMASHHTASMNPADITKDTTAELCSNCHNLNADYTISTSGNYIASGQQYSEWKTSGGHFDNGIVCGTCHNPHIRTIADGGGLNNVCLDCHPGKSVSYHVMAVLACTDCHMPKSVHQADSTNYFTADARSHIFRINTASTYDMMSDDGLSIKADGLSLNYVCYQCHKDENGNGGANITRTMIQLSDKATGFHSH